jgi:SAM-dependent methyltransferase
VYLPLLRGVPELIFGDPGRALSHDDAHLDRDLDLRFSGEVFAAMCRTPFLEMALPLFDDDPDVQPALVVDTGCGDGALLATLYAAVRERTARGRRLDEHPLLMVGVDPSPVARRATASRLAAARVPHLVLDGDIADPDGLARELAAAGHDAGNALHVCKSAIHDRAYRPAGPAGLAASAGGAPVTTTAFARPDGPAIPATAMAANLAGLFRDWRPLARRHGWIVIEAHSLGPAQAAGLIGRTLATALDATHGYSCQYPVEPEVFAWAARAAGFTSRAHREPGADALGHTLLTIDHFVVAGLRGTLRQPSPPKG